MLTSKEREIAIQAIAARATGTPAQAASQILQGVTALQYPGKPVIIWAEGLGVDEKIEALESELRDWLQYKKELQEHRLTRWSTPRTAEAENPSSQDQKGHSSPEDTPDEEASQSEAPNAAEGSTALPSEKKPDQEASDAYR